MIELNENAPARQQFVLEALDARRMLSADVPVTDIVTKDEAAATVVLPADQQTGDLVETTGDVTVVDTGEQEPVPVDQADPPCLLMTCLVLPPAEQNPESVDAQPLDDVLPTDVPAGGEDIQVLMYSMAPSRQAIAPEQVSPLSPPPAQASGFTGFASQTGLADALFKSSDKNILGKDDVPLV